MIENKKETILENGVHVISHRNTGLHMAEIALYFRCGSIYENDLNNGITHLVEHLFFRKLNGIPQKELYFRMESIGTTLMGTTLKDGIYFHMTVLTSKIREAIDIIVNILAEFQWDLNTIEKEKKVVVKQIDFDYESFYENLDNIYFENTLFEKSIMGKAKAVARYDQNVINNWKKRFFHCNNACFVLTGNFSTKDEEYLISCTNKIKNSGEPIPILSIIPSNYCARTKKSDRIIYTDQDITSVRIYFDVEKELFFSARLLSSILAEGVGSKLALSLREKFALTDEVYSTVYLNKSSARIVIDFQIYNHDLEKSLEIFISEVKQMKQEITNNEYLSSITFFTDNQKKLDDPKDLNFYYGRFCFLLGYPNVDLQYVSNIYKNISIQKLVVDSNKIFKKNNMSIYLQNNPRICGNKEVKKILSKVRDEL